MNKGHEYLNKLLSELKGLETSMQQLEGLVTQAAENGDVEKHKKYQHDLTRLISNRRELMHRIDETRQEPQ